MVAFSPPCHIQNPWRVPQLFLPTATTQDISPPKANRTVTALSPHNTPKREDQRRRALETRSRHGSAVFRAYLRPTRMGAGPERCMRALRGRVKVSKSIKHSPGSSRHQVWLWRLDKFPFNAAKPIGWLANGIWHSRKCAQLHLLYKKKRDQFKNMKNDRPFYFGLQ